MTRLYRPVRCLRPGRGIADVVERDAVAMPDMPAYKREWAISRQLIDDSSGDGHLDRTGREPTAESGQTR